MATSGTTGRSTGRSARGRLRNAASARCSAAVRALRAAAGGPGSRPTASAGRRIAVGPISAATSPAPTTALARVERMPQALATGPWTRLRRRGQASAADRPRPPRRAFVGRHERSAGRRSARPGIADSDRGARMRRPAPVRARTARRTRGARPAARGSRSSGPSWDGLLGVGRDRARVAVRSAEPAIALEPRAQRAERVVEARFHGPSRTSRSSAVSWSDSPWR